MKFIFQVLALVLLTLQSTGLQAQENSKDTGIVEEYQVVGQAIQAEEILSAYQAQQFYRDLKPGDSLKIAFRADVTTVCKKKGCWMKLALADGQEVMVRFKEYAFFVPKDIEEREVVVNGMAYVEEMSVADQRHYAQDGGASSEEIAAINEPKRTLSFLAEGVHIRLPH